MCGFIGYIQDRDEEINEIEYNNLMNMNRIITHRGPDDEGYYTDNYVRFGFRRLSIVDLQSGHQPLSFEDHRYWIIFNGEIYNHVEIRNQLTQVGVKFKTNSDTEVLLALYAQKKEACLEDLRGMFSFVIWDKQDKELFSARDRFGIKPLYMMQKNDKVYFASEQKSLLMTDHDNQVNQESLHHYLSYQYVPEPETMLHDIHKVQPGHYIKKKVGHSLEVTSYWEPEFHVSTTAAETQMKQIQESLRQSVKAHMRSDVPVGAFLSGGIDSTSIVAIAKEFNPSIKTFTVGFEREGYSEIDVAKETAEALDVENIHYKITPEDFINELPRIIWHMDDPVADPAAIPLYFVAREASKHVKVVLSGEGADELFGGYNIYREPQSLNAFKYLPGQAKKMLTSFANMLPEGTKGKSFIERGCTAIGDRYLGNAKIYNEEEKSKLLKHYDSKFDYRRITEPFYEKAKNYDDVKKMQYIDICTWMRGDILVKADKMTMAHSLELRVPFLDKEVFTIASQLSTTHNISNNTTKYLLRQAMKEVIPAHVLNRKKLGFPVPIRHWLKDELYPWAYQLITESQTNYLLNKAEIFRLLEEHRGGQKDNSRKLWTTLVFMIWHQLFVESKEVDMLKDPSTIDPGIELQNA
ncbi:asparagine synthase (glutamine-hydrolyzing) [Alkalihalobacillus macyae]|uniref:asparagine synthase (glutamine-hydrolyzing) n=1 Tax=Guptibacillus hwajinpoensis TaxID=208199 RepID=UPI00273CD519|nr:asparagine synthase (glutamine-hydrolyzing) [Alkalihalobacillus macyae]MDP4552325.1 asparagine synthase (glutamine-hydrolyzing) [Alkalihalobacillus macyae]